MPWIYRCPADKSVQGVWPDHEQALARTAGVEDREFRRCECGKLRRLVYQPGPGGQVIDDVPEHMNPAFPVPVRGRTHLKLLQKQFGTQDFEPSARTREMLAESRAKVTHGRR